METGSHFGPYEILSRIGAGGMGEVWRARDTRLGRDVAIKILPTDFAQDAKLKIRFEREAQTISHLAHPNICTLFDVGENYLVMELLEGESLADRLTRGPLPLTDVVRVGVQIAEALGKAHREGVVHRDLKPGNIMLTKSGAKLLDFGLAKSTTVAPSPADQTVQKPLTEQGTVLGTFQYMAPEQLAGEEPDPRTDIFALGAVLFEMATGKRAFEGKNRASLIAAIVGGEPRAMRELQPLTPPMLEHVILKCLEKDPDDRWQSASDIAGELRWIGQAGPRASPAPARQARRRRGFFLAASAIGWLLAIAASVTAAVYLQRFKTGDHVTHAEIDAALASKLRAPLSLSPDGTRIAAVRGSVPSLWLRDLRSGDARFLAGTEEASYPFWSPDGRFIGFFTGTSLKKVDVETGAVLTLSEAHHGRGGTWSPKGIIVVAPDLSGPLVRISENGGATVPVTKLSGSMGTHRNPAFLPDGNHFVYTSGGTGMLLGSSLRVGALDGAFDRKLIDYALTAAFTNGWLLTVRDQNLVAQRFNPGKFELSGKPVVIAQHVDWHDERGVAMFAVGADTLVYRQRKHPKFQVVRLTAAGPVTVGEPGEYGTLVASPDGKRVAVNRYDAITGSSDVWLLSLEDGSPTRSTFDVDGTMENATAFSPDGRQLLLYTRPKGVGKLWIQPIGGGTSDTLFTSIHSITGAHWSPDGKWILLDSQRPVTGLDLELIAVGGDRKPSPFLRTDASEIDSQFSPDGRLVAYASNDTGRFEVYVTNFPSGSAKWQVSQIGGSLPRWSPDGSRLYFMSGRRIFCVDLLAGSTFSAGVPRRFETFDFDVSEFDIAKDGTIVALRVIDPDERPITVVHNWHKLLLQEH
jgi:eukaryotic-like serine/threonine-protein kinase